MEKRIIVTIDKEGQISAKTEGITGAVCLKELETLMKDIAEMQDIRKTDEYFMEDNILPKINLQNQQKLGK